MSWIKTGETVCEWKLAEKGKTALNLASKWPLIAHRNVSHRLGIFWNHKMARIDQENWEWQLKGNIQPWHNSTDLWHKKLAGPFTAICYVPCEAIVQFKAYPSTRTLSFALPPWALSTLIALIGYLASPLFPARLTAITALTTISLKKSDTWPINLEDIDVLATLMTLSFPSSSTLIVKCSWIYLQASLKIKMAVI